MELKVKVWLADDKGKGILGTGRYRLLREVGRCGSLREAAENLGMSYRKAWGDIRTAERLLGFALLERRRGGRGGGACSLTEKAKKLLSAYVKAVTKIEAEKNKQYNLRIRKALDIAMNV